MEKLSFEDVKKGRGFASEELREELINNVKEGDYIVNFAYTDYGGYFFDKVAIVYFKEYYKDNILSENTCYYGENAFIYGELAREFWESNEKYFMGFENMEEFYFKMENGQYKKDFNHFLNDIKGDYIFNFDEALNWLIENKTGYYNIYPSGVDFSWDNLINELLKESIIFNEGENLLYLLIKVGYNKEYSEYLYNTFENGNINNIPLDEKTLSIIKEYEAKALTK